MCDFDGELRDLGEVPPDLLAPLDHRLVDAETVWVAADQSKPNRFSVFESTQHIVFQYPEDLRSHERSSYSPLWLEWTGVIAPLIGYVTRGYGYSHGRTARIMLARLRAGQTIARHVDRSPSAETPHKIHIPIATDDRVRFMIGDGDYELARGRAYEVNNRRPHEVVNGSASDRVHLIFDYFDAT